MVATSAAVRANLQMCRRCAAGPTSDGTHTNPHPISTGTQQLRSELAIRRARARKGGREGGMVTDN